VSAATVHQNVVVLLTEIWMQSVWVTTAICVRKEWSRKTHDVRSPSDVKIICRVSKRNREESAPLTFLAQAHMGLPGMLRAYPAALNDRTCSRNITNSPGRRGLRSRGCRPTVVIDVADVGVVDRILVATVVVVGGGAVAVVVARLTILGETSVRRVQVATIGVHNVVMMLEPSTT
jgi:hypothetical protein